MKIGTRPAALLSCFPLRSSQDGGHPVSIGDPDGQTAIQLRVDQALARVGARVATTAEVAKAIKEIDRIATLVRQSRACAGRWEVGACTA